MKNDLKNIQIHSAIRDLHIHSCKSPKSSGEFSHYSVEEYLELLHEIFSDYPDLEMISFTDHNYISKEVYSAAFKKFKNLSIIYGIEVDTYLDERGRDLNQVKHVIYYFDPLKFCLEKHSELINEKLDGKPIILAEFLNFLVTEIKVPFLISPHFIKQGSKGIEFHLTGEEEIKKNIDKYIDQMICFWETSSSINFEYAKDYLEKFDRQDKVCIVAFSDSHDSKTLRKYLSTPHQYFNSLPSFSGLRMAASDASRIVFERESLTDIQKPSYIGKVTVGNNNEIFFSPKLNVVIGGRGMGKSLLIDGIAYFLDKNKLINNKQLKKRVKFLDRLKFKVYDYNKNELSNHKFSFEYFNQGYVLSLFEENGYENLTNLYFKDEFIHLEKYDIDCIRSSIKNEINYNKIMETPLTDNLNSICEKMPILDAELQDVVLEAGIAKSPLKYLDHSKIIEALRQPSITPQELKGNKIIEKAYLDFISLLQSEIRKYNEKTYLDNFQYDLYVNYKEICAAKDNSRKLKNQTIELIKSKLTNEFIPIINRVSLVNAIIAAMKNRSDKKQKKVGGFENHYFMFSRELYVEPLNEYMFKVFQEYFSKNKVKEILSVDRDNILYLEKLVEGYCYFPNLLIAESKELADLDNELTNLSSLIIKESCEIYYFDGISLKKLSDLSPGSKTNILMEYIVHKDSKLPLLIDQPEDNIDNKTIFKELTNWFAQLKNKRQVIVATHDANIVVNSDAENVIICNQNNNNEFDYKNGALEYGDIINDVSIILDGGRFALERRLNKYGKEYNN